MVVLDKASCHDVRTHEVDPSTRQRARRNYILALHGAPPIVAAPSSIPTSDASYSTTTASTNSQLCGFGLELGTRVRQRRYASQPTTSTSTSTTSTSNIRCTLCQICRGPPGEHRGYPKSAVRPFRLAGLRLEDSTIDSVMLEQLQEMSVNESDWPGGRTTTAANHVLVASANEAPTTAGEGEVGAGVRCQHEHAQWCSRGRGQVVKEEDSKSVEEDSQVSTQ